MDYTFFEKLYNDNKEYLFKKFFYLTKDEDKAYDLVQSVFFRIIKYSNYRSIEIRNKSFLLKTGYNIYFSEFKKSKKDFSREIRYSLGMPSEVEIEKESLDNFQIFSKIREVIDSLETTDRIKKALLLRYFGENDLQTISYMNNVSKRTTIRDLKKGVKLLKQEINTRGIYNE